MIPDSRNDFNESWLSEMPMGKPTPDAYKQIVYNIKERIEIGSKVQQLSSSLYKIAGQQLTYYWYELNDEIALGIELLNRPQVLVVNIVGKNPKLAGKPPFASDLYNIILNNNNLPIRIYSDVFLSDEGLGIWKRLFNNGHTISVYDNQNPGVTFKTFTSLNDFDQFFKHNDPSYKRYQYVLSEVGEVLAETRGFFHTRRYRELSGLL